jgi:plasmid stability protein
MSRLTITLDDNLHVALKETAARQGRSIAAIVEESLRLRGIQGRESARLLVDRVRRHSDLGADDALAIAVAETRAARSQ